MSTTPEFTDLVNRLNQELNQTEQQATGGLNRTRDLLSQFSDNVILTQYFAFFSTILFLVENSKRQMQDIVDAIASDADVQSAGEDLAALLGKVLEAKLRVEVLVDNLGRIVMNHPLDEKKLIEGLKLAKEAEQAARKMSEMATAIAYKYKNLAAGTYNPENQKRLCEILDVQLPSKAEAETELCKD